MTRPRWARALLQHAVADDPAGLSIVADLDQEFHERSACFGPAAARRWYWEAAISIWWWSAWKHPHRSHHQPHGGLMFDWIGDIRHAVRVAAKSPGQTMLIVATLALAIGITTVGFSFADTVVLRGLPIAEPDDTVVVYGVDAREPERRGGVFLSDFLDLRERARSVESLSAWTQARATLMRQGADPERVTVCRVTGDLFSVWGLRLQHGRGLRADDDSPAAPRVAVLTDRYWRETFGGAAAAIGESVMIDGTPHEIVGVLTPDAEFDTLAAVAFWVSYPVERTVARDERLVRLTGRLAGGATVANAAAEFQAMARTFEAEHPETNRGRDLLLLPADRAIGGPNLYFVITLLVAAAALVTVIASVNVAGVLLARAVVRQREFGLRTALGAGRTRVFRQLATEGGLLALLGGAGGLLVAHLALQLVGSIDADPIFRQIRVDWHEMVFVATLAAIAPLVFSLAPALAAMRVDVVGVLNAGGSRMVGSGGRMRAALAAAQIAVAVGLAVVAGLVLRTGAAMRSVPTGVDASGVVRFALALDQEYPHATVRRGVMRDIAERLAADHAAAGAIEALPATANETPVAVAPDGQTAPGGHAEHWAHVVRVDHNALQTLALPLVEGRWLSAADVEGDADVALLSVEAARRYFGDARGALGRRIVIRAGEAARAHQVIGITGDVRNTMPRQGMPPRVWLPLPDPRVVTFVVRTSGDVESVAASVRRVARELAPAVPIEALETYDQAIRRQTASDRIAMGMLIAFAATAVLFAAIGLYGTIAVSANMRRAEFATRFALGAHVRDVVGLVLGQALRLLAIGLVPGLAGGLLAAIAIRRLLYGVAPLDPLNILGVVGLLTVISIAASIGPVLRSAKVDVLDAIRTG